MWQFERRILIILCIVCSGFVTAEQRLSRCKLNNLQKHNEYQYKNSSDHQIVTSNVTDVVENEIAKLIYDLIDHFKKDDPVGLPFPIPDPIEIQGISQQVLGATLTMKPVFINGISKFRIEGAKMELDDIMQGSCQLSFHEMVIDGNYTLRHFLGRPYGPFTIIIKDLKVFGVVKLGVDSSGKLRAQNVETDLKVAHMSVDFQNLGVLKSLLGSFVNSKDDSFFNMIKPFIIRDSKEMIKKIIDEKIHEHQSSFGVLPNSIGTIDFAIAEGRKFVKEKYDPLTINDIENVGVFGYKIHGTKIHGVSSFYRVGDIRTTIENKNVLIDFNIGTQILNGKTTWEVSIANGMISRSGHVRFSVQFIKVFVQVSQPLDLSKKLKIEDIQIDLGNIQTLSSGIGTFDYVIEFLLNTLPNLIRQQIMEVISKPIIHRIHQYTEQIDLESLIKEKVLEYSECGTISMDSLLKNEL